VAPGVVRHIEGSRFALGELDGSDSDRARRISALLQAAELKCPVLEDIRAEIWLKAWGNLAFNPISALTHGTMAEIARFPLTREFTIGLMTEAARVAERLDIQFRVPMEKRLAGAERVGEHRTSMLQDVLAGRPLEHEAILGAVIEMASLVEVDTPNLRALFALCSLRNATCLAEARRRGELTDHDAA
jgi:2-dehydropantoate 2-reductase